MLKYIIRLDDACPTMNKEKWERVENLLDKYDIKPIVGIIPDNKDPEFNHATMNNFWKVAKKWQDKQWIIAQHGLNHNLSKTVRTEFEGIEFNTQLRKIKDGYNILQNNHINPVCFFAPAHTFDDNTIKACKEIRDFKFISDGYAFYPYNRKDMLMMPSVFDTPHKIASFGIFTFIYHPNNMEEKDFNYLEEFIKKNRHLFDINISEIIKKFSNRKRNVFDYFLEKMIFVYRKVRKRTWKKTK